jgi:hypothetical protein
MMKVSMREYPVYSSSHRAELLSGILLDGNATREMLIAIEKR